MIHFHVITLFPESMRAYTDTSMIGRAQKNKKIKILYYNPRDYTKNKHKRVDRKPYGGGPGMVLEAESVLRAVDKARGRKKNVKIIFLGTRGKQFTDVFAQKYVKKYAHVILIAGHYEGVDARVRKILKAEEVSIGPYILTGGEVPALVIIDVMTRFVPGVLGNESSLEEKRAPSSEVYTRPEVLIYKEKKYRVPKVLLSGHHKNIEKWKRKTNNK